MTGTAAKARETPTAKQRRVWDKAGPGDIKQIAFFEKIWFGGGREWIGSRAHGRVLEVAVGTGRDRTHHDPEVTVTGVARSPEMLALARQHAAALCREANLREGDAGYLPFPDSSFDTVVCALSLCSIPDPAQAIGEMHRVVVPGGPLLLRDHVGSTWPPLYGAQWLVEQLTRQLAGEFQTRRRLPLAQSAGSVIEEPERLKAGTIERLRAVKPAEDLRPRYVIPITNGMT